MAVSRANINPRVLEWARKRLFPNVEAASAPLKVSAKQLEMWEHGEDSPSYKQARRMADRLRIPFGYLYLSNPPPEAIFPLPDLRNHLNTSPSIDLLEVIHDALRKQAWYREEMLLDQATPLPFIGKFSLDSPFQEIAANISATIGIDDSMRKEAGSWTAFLAEFVKRTENVGVLVLRSGIAAGNTHRPLNINEFRGFALVDTYAPVVFVNTKDPIASRIFTLAHEIVHLWIGESGISNPHLFLNSGDYEVPVEELCHKVAAEVLRPEVNFLLSKAEYIFSSNNLYWRQYHHKPSIATDVDLDNSGNYGKYFNPLIARNSRRFTVALIAALAEGRIGHIDAARLLNIRGRTLDPLTRHLLGVSLKNA